MIDFLYLFQNGPMIDIMIFKDYILDRKYMNKIKIKKINKYIYILLKVINGLFVLFVLFC